MYTLELTCSVRQYITFRLACAAPSALPPTHLTAVCLLSSQHFHAVCDLAASQVSLVGAGKFALQCKACFDFFPPRDVVTKSMQLAAATLGVNEAN